MIEQVLWHKYGERLCDLLDSQRIFEQQGFEPWVSSVGFATAYRTETIATEMSS